MIYSIFLLSLLHEYVMIKCFGCLCIFLTLSLLVIYILFLQTLSYCIYIFLRVYI